MVIHLLLNGIKNAFIGGSAVAALTTAFAGRYFRDRAKGSPAFPYVVCEVPAGQPGMLEYYGGASAEPVILFKVVGEGCDATALMMKVLTDALDDLFLTLTGATQTGVWRQGEPVPIELPADAQGDDIWQWAVAYQYSVE